MRGCSGGCVVTPGGVFFSGGRGRGHAWFFLGGMHSFLRGACVGFSGGCMVFSGGSA